MSLTEGLRRGMVLRHDGQLYQVLDFSTAHSGKQRPTVHVKLRHVKTGHAVDRSLDQLGKVEEIPTEFRNLQYLYHAGDRRVFMDNESFEEVSLGRECVGPAAEFLEEGQAYRAFYVEGQPLTLDLAPVVVMSVAETAAVEHAGGQGSVYKDAKLRSGITVSVPLFVKTGDKIRVKTDTREYVGKEH